MGQVMVCQYASVEEGQKHFVAADPPTFTGHQPSGNVSSSFRGRHSSFLSEERSLSTPPTKKDEAALEHATINKTNVSFKKASRNRKTSLFGCFSIEACDVVDSSTTKADPPKPIQKPSSPTIPPPPRIKPIDMNEAQLMSTLPDFPLLSPRQIPTKQFQLESPPVQTPDCNQERLAGFLETLRHVSNRDGIMS